MMIQVDDDMTGICESCGAEVDIDDLHGGDCMDCYTETQRERAAQCEYDRNVYRFQVINHLEADGLIGEDNLYA